MVNLQSEQVTAVSPPSVACTDLSLLVLLAVQRSSLTGADGGDGGKAHPNVMCLSETTSIQLVDDGEWSGGS